MTKQNKLIVGAVVVLGAYYLYDRSKKMKAVSDLKAGAEVTEVEVAEATIKPVVTGGIKPAPPPFLTKMYPNFYNQKLYPFFSLIRHISNKIRHICLTKLNTFFYPNLTYL